MKNIKKLLLCSAILSTTLSISTLTTNFEANAYAYRNKSENLIQPDNSKVDVLVTGDEYYQHIESIDGYTLCRNEEGWICYADLNEDKTEYVATDKIYTGEAVKENTSLFSKFFRSKDDINLDKHLTITDESLNRTADIVKDELKTDEIELQSEGLIDSNLRASSNSQTINGLTILIDFPDEKSAISRNELNNFFNQTGYTGYSNNGSVKDYFYDISGGKVTYTNTLTEFYTAKHNKSYYDGAHITNYSSSLELIDEALNSLKSRGFDFSKFTTDKYGYIKGLNVLYAGDADAGWSKGLWPHQGYLTSGFNSNGVKVQRYELSNIGNSVSLGTICHENGHLLFGFPDLYDYSNITAGCGSYSLMSYISDYKNPAPPDPYCRNILSGWNKTIDLDSYNNSQVTAYANGNGAHDVFRWTGDSSTEYYLIENLQQSGRYEYIPDEGLIIWHIDKNGDNANRGSSKSKRNLVSVVQADNRFDLENNNNYGSYGDLFHKSTKSSFTSTSVPSSKWYTGASSGLDITNISKKGSVMTFNVGNSNNNNNNNNNNNTTNSSKYTNITKYVANVTTSFCSSWESTTALNDGFDPLSSADRTHAVYGNWPETGSQYVQYTFDKPYTISRSDVYWFKDNQGIDVPSSYIIRYFDDADGTWKVVDNASGLGTDINKFNTTTFTPVTTRSVYIEIISNGSNSTGILDWRLFS